MYHAHINYKNVGTNWPSPRFPFYREVWAGAPGTMGDCPLAPSRYIRFLANTYIHNQCSSYNVLLSLLGRCLCGAESHITYVIIIIIIIIIITQVLIKGKYVNVPEVSAFLKQILYVTRISQKNALHHHDIIVSIEWVPLAIALATNQAPVTTRALAIVTGPNSSKYPGSNSNPSYYSGPSHHYPCPSHVLAQTLANTQVPALTIATTQAPATTQALATTQAQASALAPTIALALTLATTQVPAITLPTFSHYSCLPLAITPAYL